MYTAASLDVNLTLYLTALQLTGFPEEAALGRSRIVALLPGQPPHDHSQLVHSILFGPCTRSLAFYAFITNNCSPLRTSCDNDVHSTAIFTCKPYTELQLRYQLTHLWHVACRLSHVRCRDRHQCRLSPHRFWVGSPTSTSLRTVDDDTANNCHCLRMLSVI